MENAVTRIRDMEKAFDAILSAHAAGKGASSCLAATRKLSAYMDSGQWLSDYALDEAGRLPRDLKRGVLSQDALYNLLQELKDEEKQR